MSNSGGGHRAGEGSKRRKTLKKRSEVWDHFTEEDDTTGKERRAKCKHCQNELTIQKEHGTTSHLNRHLIRHCHKIPNGEKAQLLRIPKTNQKAAIESGQPPETQEPPITQAFENEISNLGPTLENDRNFHFTQEEEMHVKNAILANFPFLAPNVKKSWCSPMANFDMERAINVYHQREKAKMVAELGNLTSRVCFSLDFMKEEGWISITAHFINNDFKLVKKLIDFKKFPTGVPGFFEVATDIIEGCISDYKLENKIFSFTLDDSYNLYLKEAFLDNSLFGKWYDLFLPCIKETYVDSFDTCSTHLNAIRMHANYTFSEEFDTKGSKFNEIAKEKWLSPLNEDWFKKQQPIHWRCDGTATVVVDMLIDALPYKEYFYQKIEWDEISWDLETLQAAIDVVDPLYNFKYPTSNLYIKSQRKCFEKVNLDFEDYFDDENDDHPYILYVASVLDPRCKLESFNYYFKVLPYDDSLSEILDKIDEIGKFFKTLFLNYMEDNSSSSFGKEEDISSDVVINQFLRHTKFLEIKKYLTDEIIDTDDFDLLGWWKENKLRYPTLYRMARDVLAMPACIYSAQESLNLDLSILEGVNPEIVEAAICSKDWILSDVESLPKVVQKLNDQQQPVGASKDDGILTSKNIGEHNYGDKIVDADNMQLDSEVESISGIAPAMPSLNKVTEERIIKISKNNQETPRPKPDEDVENTKAAMHQVREKIRGKILFDKFGLGLNREEILAIEIVEQIEPEVVIVKIKEDQNNCIDLTRERMISLVLPSRQDGIARWLIDEVINAYINIINRQKGPSDKVMRVSTLDTQLLQRGLQECKSASYVQELGKNILKNDLVFFPINDNGTHWYVGALNFDKLEFQILDSKFKTILRTIGWAIIDNKTYKAITDDLRSGIQRCIRSALHSSKDLSNKRNPEQIDITMWKVHVIQTAPQQIDGSSCGLFALKYMQFWDGSEFSKEFTQSDMELFRKKIVHELIMSELNLMSVIKEEIKNLLTEMKWRDY